MTSEQLKFKNKHNINEMLGSTISGFMKNDILVYESTKLIIYSQSSQQKT